MNFQRFKCLFGGETLQLNYAVLWRVIVELYSEQHFANVIFQQIMEALNFKLCKFLIINFLTPTYCNKFSSQKTSKFTTPIKGA